MSASSAVSEQDLELLGRMAAQLQRHECMQSLGYYFTADAFIRRDLELAADADVQDVVANWRAAIAERDGAK